MKNIATLAALAAAMVFSPLIAREYDYSDRNSQKGEKKQRSGLFEDLQKKPMTETALLLQLDKEGRQKFRNLPRKSRIEVLETINSEGIKDYNRVIDQAVEDQKLSVERDQIRMLHNGMDRIQR